MKETIQEIAKTTLVNGRSVLMTKISTGGPGYYFVIASFYKNGEVITEWKKEDYHDAERIHRDILADEMRHMITA